MLTVRFDMLSQSFQLLRICSPSGSTAIVDPDFLVTCPGPIGLARKNSIIHCVCGLSLMYCMPCCLLAPTTASKQTSLADQSQSLVLVQPVPLLPAGPDVSVAQ